MLTSAIVLALVAIIGKLAAEAVGEAITGDAIDPAKLQPFVDAIDQTSLAAVAIKDAWRDDGWAGGDTRDYLVGLAKQHGIGERHQAWMAWKLHEAFNGKKGAAFWKARWQGIPQSAQNIKDLTAEVQKLANEVQAMFQTGQSGPHVQAKLDALQNAKKALEAAKAKAGQKVDTGGLIGLTAPRLREQIKRQLPAIEQAAKEREAREARKDDPLAAPDSGDGSAIDLAIPAIIAAKLAGVL